MKNRRMLFALLALFLIELLVAQVPRIMNYQGKITDTSGVAIHDSDRVIAFLLYDSETGGSPIWAETLSVEIVNGLFDVQLGEVHPIDLSFDEPYWIQLLIDQNDDGDVVDATDEFLTPREKLAAVSFSFRSVYSDTADYYLVQHDATLSGDGTTDSPLSVLSSSDCCPSTVLKPFATSGPIPGWTYTGYFEEKDGFWNTKASMPTARSAFAAAVVNNKIYAIGGYNLGNLSTNEEYDPATDSWTAKASMPTARYWLAAAVLNNRIYAIGGYNSLITNEMYNPSTDIWISRAPMSTGRHGLAAAAAGGKIYAIGGSNSGSRVSTNEEYDRTTNSWTTKTPMPTARYRFGAASVNGKIYAIGGSDGTALSTNEEYDLSTDSWTTKMPMPTARSQLAIVAANNKIYALGGRLSSTDYVSTNEEYDPITNSWITRASMPTARGRLAAAFVNGKLYAIGGYDGSNHLSINEEFSIVAFYWFQKD